MTRLLITTVSLLALGLAPSVAQDRMPRSDASSLDYPTPDDNAVDHALTSSDVAQDQDGAVKDGSVRDAVGDPPVRPSSTKVGEWSAGFGREIPFPPQDVSDNDLEPHGREYPSGPPGEAAANESDGGAAETFAEGEQVPGDIERFQGEGVWDGDDDWASNAPQSVPSEPAARPGNQLSAERGPAGAWDGPEEGAPYHRGRLHADRSATGAIAGRPEQDEAKSEMPRSERRETREDWRDERRLRLARVALRTARHALPEARFRTYEFEVKDGRRVIEIAGTEMDSGRRVEVEVFGNGRVRSIAEAVPFDAVPGDIRRAVTGELKDFEVVHSLRTLQRDFDVYYEFAGFSASGRPATVEIRADGRNMSVDYLDRG